MEGGVVEGVEGMERGGRRRGRNGRRGEGDERMEGWGEVMKKKTCFWHKNAKVKTAMQYKFKDL